MDDSFAFRSTAPLRRRVEPWAVKAALVGTLIVLGVGAFAGWVIASERASFEPAHGRPVGLDVGVSRIDGPATPSGTDADAEESARIALTAARAASTEHGTFLDAGPAQLSALQPGYLFVDGPSTTSTIVSVAAQEDRWAAAVLGPSGTCFWIRADGDGGVDSGTSSVCTGSSILEGAGPWASVGAGRGGNR
jgi:hypothetical protein